jgi:Flp pilus assembly protein TadB
VSSLLNPLRVLAPYLAGLSASFLAYALTSRVNLEVSRVRGTTTRRLERFAGGELKPSWANRVGDRLLDRLGLDPYRWVLLLRWAQLGGHFTHWTVGGLVGQATLYGLVGALYAALMGVAFLWLAAPALFAYPFLRVRSKAQRVQKQVRRALPEMATLVAAEMAAGNAPDQALARASKLPGPLGKLLARALIESRSSGRPLFSRGREIRGTLVDTLAEMRLPELLAFASQLDLVAGKGASGLELMDNIARGLSREHRMRVLRAAEELESDLVIPATLFFFLPFVAAVMIPLMIPLLQMF